MGRFPLLLLTAGLAVGWSGASAPAGDWPTWRYDPRRSAASADDLPAELHLQWLRQLPAPMLAWPDEPRLGFDACYEPVAAGKTLWCDDLAHEVVYGVAWDPETNRHVVYPPQAFFEGGLTM